MEKQISRILRFWEKPENPRPINPQVKTEPATINPANLIKMSEAVKLLRISAPTVRKYSRMGYYSEYRFGEKVFFYNREEILSYMFKRDKRIIVSPDERGKI